MHNQLVVAIYGNVTREMPDHGVASWVSANDKPTSGVGNKPVSGDAAEQRLKTEIMQLPSRDRRRIKDLNHNDVSSPEVSRGVKLIVTRLTPTRHLLVSSGNQGGAKLIGTQTLCRQVLVV